jgi:hypothetical protein
MEVVIAIVIIAFLALLGGLLLYYWSRQSHSKRLRERFGNEYYHTVLQAETRREAERELAEREKRVEKLHLKEIPPERRLHFAEEWRAVQVRFVDDPSRAVDEAQRLVEEVMGARGYPMTNFERIAADVSADHPNVMEDYRAAHAIAFANAEGLATTEDLRRAMIHYRLLFAELLGAVPVS